jgi:hypothetical protein
MEVADDDSDDGDEHFAQELGLWTKEKRFRRGGGKSSQVRALLPGQKPRKLFSRGMYCLRVLVPFQ